MGMILICLLALLFAGSHSTPLALDTTRSQDSFELRQLTVPPDRLPAGCRLQPADSKRLVSGPWAPLSVMTNPWEGDDRAVVARIRERMVPPTRVPDGPPVTAADLARMRLRAADDVEAAYVASYADADKRLLDVLAVRFAKEIPRGAAPQTGEPGRRISSGRTLMLVTGDGSCADAVAAYLAEVVAR